MLSSYQSRLQNFGEHGRELISSEIGLHLLRLLCDPAARRTLLAAYSISEAAVDALLPRTVFKARVGKPGACRLHTYPLHAAVPA